MVIMKSCKAFDLYHRKNGKQNGIDLIEIPYTCDLLPYIRHTLEEKGYLFMEKKVQTCPKFKC